MASLRTRSVLLATAFVAGTALLTACQSDTDDKASSATSATASSTQAAAEGKDSAGADSNPDAAASAGTKAPAADSGSSGTGKAGSGSTSQSAGSGAGQSKGKSVSGTWFGNVAYLAPGKYTVSGPKGEEQAFFTAEDTEIWGAGDICGDENGQSATKCTEEELEAAAQKGVSAEVKISNGIATRITDDH
jgi:hypothetical protein